MLQIAIDLDIKEGRILFEALAELPFKRVFELIAKINETANRSLAGVTDETTLARFRFTGPELALTIEALGEQPFKRVHSILEKIHNQLNTPED